MKIGRVTVSDRASAGVYPDRSGPAVEEALRAVCGGSLEFLALLVPDDRAQIAAVLRELVDVAQCDLVITTGGTGIAPRDLTPEATREVLERELPGFGEAMRLSSFGRVPTAILSRATAGTRGRCLIINLPGKPSAVTECLTILGPAVREALAFLRGEDPHATPASRAAELSPSRAPGQAGFPE